MALLIILTCRFLGSCWRPFLTLFLLPPPFLSSFLSPLSTLSSVFSLFFYPLFTFVLCVFCLFRSVSYAHFWIHVRLRDHCGLLSLSALCPSLGILISCFISYISLWILVSCIARWSLHCTFYLCFRVDYKQTINIMYYFCDAYFCLMMKLVCISYFVFLKVLIKIVYGCLQASTHHF